MKWYFQALKNTFNFKGRARRKEYWMFRLVDFLFLISFFITGFLVAGEKIPEVVGVIPKIYDVLIFIPYLSVSVRRLHDIGKTGWWVLMLVPSKCSLYMGIDVSSRTMTFVSITMLVTSLIGIIILFMFACKDSQKGENKYGFNPIGELL
ncbi:DUF805 domain-containing protein [Gottfriedia solisilvae]|uniref:DUF805 domain-containing protein n=1 Tax=Gottfriedia solisilvae TaxID=1516104 RepID=UPI003D2F258E